VAKSWPDEDIPVFLHFPGCTSTPSNHLYESFGFFCPIDSLDYVEMLETEDVLLDWSLPKYLNYTHGNKNINPCAGIKTYEFNLIYLLTVQ
jgi:hypothetical protein